MDKLEEVRKKPDKDTIERLEEMLEDAKKGELQAFAGVCVWWDERTSNTWSITKPFSRSRIGAMLGELTKLQIDLALNDDELLVPLQNLRDEG